MGLLDRIRQRKQEVYQKAGPTLVQVGLAVDTPAAPTPATASTPPSAPTARQSISLRKPAGAVELDKIRFPFETELYRALVRTPAGARLEAIWKQSETNRSTCPVDFARLQMLRNAVRCSAEASPALHKMVQVTQRILGAEFPYEIYQSGGAQPNAACHWAKDRLLLRFTGPIHRILSPREMLFVVGHEVGHYISPEQRFGTWLAGGLDYYSIPEARSMAESAGDPLPELLFTGPTPGIIWLWSRTGEITADRVGLLCCQDLDAAVTALAKLMAGLDSTATQVSARDFLAQAEEWIEAGVDDPDDLSHPLELLRAKALQAFHASTRYAAIYPHSDVRLRGDEMNGFVARLLLPEREEESTPRDDQAAGERGGRPTPAGRPAPDAPEASATYGQRAALVDPVEAGFERFSALCCYLAATADGRITPAEKRNVGKLSNGDALVAAWAEFEKLGEAELDALFDQLSTACKASQTRRRLSMLVGRLIDVAKADRSFSKDELTVIDTIGEALGIGDLARKRIVATLGYDPFDLGA